MSELTFNEDSWLVDDDGELISFFHNFPRGDIVNSRHFNSILKVSIDDTKQALNAVNYPVYCFNGEFPVWLASDGELLEGVALVFDNGATNIRMRRPTSETVDMFVQHKYYEHLLTLLGYGLKADVDYSAPPPKVEPVEPSAVEDAPPPVKRKRKG